MPTVRVHHAAGLWLADAARLWTPSCASCDRYRSPPQKCGVFAHCTQSIFKVAHSLFHGSRFEHLRVTVWVIGEE